MDDGAVALQFTIEKVAEILEGGTGNINVEWPVGGIRSGVGEVGEGCLAKAQTVAD